MKSWATHGCKENKHFPHIFQHIFQHIIASDAQWGCLAPVVVGVISYALYIYIIRPYQRVLLSHLSGFNSATSIPPIMNNAPRNAVAGNLSPATRPTMPAQTGSPV